MITPLFQIFVFIILTFHDAIVDAMTKNTPYFAKKHKISITWFKILTLNN